MKLFYLLHISFCLLFVVGSHAQTISFVSKPLPSKVKKERKELPDIKLEMFYDLVKNLPDGYVTDGSVDYTVVLQKGIDQYDNVKFPDFPILVNDNGLALKSNSKLFFPENAVIYLEASNKGTYEVLRLFGVNDIEIYNPKIVGDRDVHLGKDGEWGMGIGIRGAKNIKIFNAVISDCWGDGIYLGYLHGKQSENIEVFNPYLDNNRRNGISITSAVNVKVQDAIVSNTNGTMPESGIVVEPSVYDARIDNIKLIRPYTFNNKRAGIQLGGFELFVKGSVNSEKEYNVTIDRPIDLNSTYGLFIGRIWDKKQLPGNSIKGSLIISNPNWLYNSGGGLVKRLQHGRGPKTILKDVNRKLKKVISSEYVRDKDLIIM